MWPHVESEPRDPLAEHWLRKRELHSLCQRGLHSLPSTHLHNNSKM